MFSKEEMIILEEFYDHCAATTLSNEEGSISTDGKVKWNQSYWTYEVMTGLILGEEGYLEAPLPHWLEFKVKYRTNSSIRRMIEDKKTMFNTLRCGVFPDNLLVCEVGYGVDVVLAMIAKDWKEIRCYDSNHGFEEGLINFFVKKHKCNLTFEGNISAHYKFDKIEKRTLVISNATHISVGKPSERIRNNENLIYLRNGVVLDRSDMPRTVEECRKKLGRGYF